MPFFSVASLLDIFKNKWVWIAALVLAICGGAYFYVKHDVKKQVATQVQIHDQQETIKSHRTVERVRTITDKIDNKYDRIAADTAKGYDNVRDTIPTSDTASAPADPLIVSTLDGLARLHGAGSPDGVPHAAD